MYSDQSIEDEVSESGKDRQRQSTIMSITNNRRKNDYFTPIRAPAKIDNTF